SPKDFIVSSEDFGIPQKRHRVFMLGVRANIKIKLEPLKKQSKQRTLEEAISALPKLRSRVSKKIDSADEWERSIQGIKNKKLNKIPEDAELFGFISECLGKLEYNQPTGKAFVKAENENKKSFNDRWFHDKKLGGYCNHETRGHIAEDLQRYFFAACFAEIHGISPKLVNFPKSLLPRHKNAESHVFSDRFRVQLYNKPATTITSHISKDGHYYIHPDPLQCRSLTVREAARIQTFPDNYFFEGPRTSQYRQVGNAVPPLLARELAGKVYGILSKMRDC
ncbi:DNA cytosine methyltransferase, partial [bacterium]|nr:DNA cytosine methyltransferase [bacterium]